MDVCQRIHSTHEGLERGVIRMAFAIKLWFTLTTLLVILAWIYPALITLPFISIIVCAYLMIAGWKEINGIIWQRIPPSYQQNLERTAHPAELFVMTSLAVMGLVVMATTAILSPGPASSTTEHLMATLGLESLAILGMENLFKPYSR